MIGSRDVEVQRVGEPLCDGEAKTAAAVAVAALSLGKGLENRPLGAGFEPVAMIAEIRVPDRNGSPLRHGVSNGGVRRLTAMSSHTIRSATSAVKMAGPAASRCSAVHSHSGAVDTLSAALGRVSTISVATTTDAPTANQRTGARPAFTMARGGWPKPFPLRGKGGVQSSRWTRSRRSCRSWASTDKVAIGRASRRRNEIGSPVSSQ